MTSCYKLSQDEFCDLLDSILTDEERAELEHESSLCTDELNPSEDNFGADSDRYREEHLTPPLIETQTFPSSLQTSTFECSVDAFCGVLV